MGVVRLFMFHFLLLMEGCFFVGIFFFDACGLCNVLSGNEFLIFRRGSQDDNKILLYSNYIRST